MHPKYIGWDWRVVQQIQFFCGSFFPARSTLTEQAIHNTQCERGNGEGSQHSDAQRRTIVYITTAARVLHHLQLYGRVAERKPELQTTCMTCQPVFAKRLCEHWNKVEQCSASFQAHHHPNVHGHWAGFKLVTVFSLLPVWLFQLPKTTLLVNMFPHTVVNIRAMPLSITQSTMTM